MALLLETFWGDLVIDLDEDASHELRSNFLKLAKARFFTSTLVFSVTQNRFCQLGDPVGDGTGGTSIHGLLDDQVEDYRKSPRRFLASTCGRPVAQAELQRKGLVVATCSSNLPNTIGSQFLITTSGGPNNALDGYIQDESLFVVLGQVVEDDNSVLDKINAAFCDSSGRPYADIRLERALPVYDPYDDPIGLSQYMLANGVVCDSEGNVTRSPSPERPKEEVVAKRISAAVVDAEDIENEDMLQLRLRQEQEETERRHDKSRAVVLEMLGDLPDADIRAPEDVLFLCKLNPVTVDEDLELIFSRFDESVKVEIIRDPDTGASLQYAFAEFSNKRAAEEAYFKMNNALIDDRRIKVDFSQSVAKLWDKYHQRARMPKPSRADGSFAKQSTARHERSERSSRPSSESRQQGHRQRRPPNNSLTRDDGPRRQDNAYRNERRRQEEEEKYRHRDHSSRMHRVHDEHRRPSHGGEDRNRRHWNERHSNPDRERKRRHRDDYSDSISSDSDDKDRRKKKRSKKSDRRHKKETRKKKKHRKHRRRESSSSSRSRSR